MRQSVRRSVSCELCAALTVLALVAPALHEWAWSIQIERDQRAAAVLLAETLATQYRLDSPLPPKSLDQGCNRLVDLPGILAVGLWNGRGKRLAASSVRDDLLSLLNRSRRSAGDGLCAESLASTPVHGEASAPLLRIEMDVGPIPSAERPARLCLIVAPRALLPDSPSSLMSFHVPVLACALFVWWIGRGMLRRRVLEPLAELVTLARGGLKKDDARALRDARDEWAILRLRLSSLEGDASVWRDQAHRMERRMQAQVAQETSRIAQDLKRVQRQAWRDALTGLCNRRFLDEKLPEVFAAQARMRGDLAIVMFDMDHFKPLNDTHGHSAGDRILTFAGELLRQCTRGDDFCVRFGGDEFLIVLPGCSAHNAAKLAERIIALFSQQAKTMIQTPLPPTMTGGVSSLKHHRPKNPAELIRLADEALYDAKQNGRRRAVIQGPRNWVPA